MLKNKKLLIIIISVILIAALVIGVVLFVLPNLQKNNNGDEEDQNEVAESSFAKLFTQIQYDEDNDDLVSTVFEYENNIDGRYDVKAHIPKINLETCSDINNEIVETFGQKLLSVLSDSNEEYTRYTIDYVYSVNDTIVSLVIKATLKEGNNPQRTIIKTYNYDVGTSSKIELTNILESRNIDKAEVQTQINNMIRTKNENAEVLATQGYNIYVRDLTSEEYKIENIENFFITQEGYIYIIFAYGNNNFTETADLIKL